MTNTNARDGHRSLLGPFGSLSAFRHRPRRSENANSIASIPTAGFATTAGQASAQHGGPSRSPLTNPSNPTRRPAAEAPPPYSPGSPQGSPPGSSPGLCHRDEDPLANLSNFDTVFVIDDSTSMQKHWREVKAILSNIAPICTKYDKDGIDIYFLNHVNSRTSPGADQADQAFKSTLQPGKASGGYNNVRDAVKVAEIFSTVLPSGNTLTGARLRSILKPYLRLYEEKLQQLRRFDKYGELDPKDMKPINVIVFTDGEPDDDLADELTAVAKKLDSLEAPFNQVGIQFFQVGSEQGAAEYFQGLDDNLGKNVEGGLRDIVDTVTWDMYEEINSAGGTVPTLSLSGEGVLKVILGAVVRRLDRQKTGSAVVTQIASDRTGSWRTGNHGAAGGSL